MSVAFTREESAETAAEFELPDRPVSVHPNLVTSVGLAKLGDALKEARSAYDAALLLADEKEKRHHASLASRDIRYLAERLASARIVPTAETLEQVAFGHRVSFRREDGRLQTYQIVGEDEANPATGSISYVSPIAEILLGKRVGEFAVLADKEIEVLAITG